MSLKLSQSNSLIKLAPYLGHMSMKVRKDVVYAKAASILLYGAELYYGQTEATTTKVTGILMRCNRAIFRRDWYKVSNRRICNEIQVDQPMEIC